MANSASGLYLFQQCAVSGLRLVGSIKGQRLSSSTARMRTDPRILVSKPPGLNCGAARIVQASSNDPAIDVGLTGEIFWPNLAAGIHRKGNVKFGDVNLH